MVRICRSISVALICLLSILFIFTGELNSKAYENISAVIPVNCLEYSADESGTYRIMIESEDDHSPEPLSGTLDVSENGEGTFSININEPGTFRYRVFQEKGDLPYVRYDSTVYIITVFVEHNDNNSLSWSLSTAIEGRERKAEEIKFRNNSVLVTTSVSTTSPITTSLTETATDIGSTASETHTTSVSAASTTAATTTTGSVISEILDTVLTGDSFPAHAMRLTLTAAALTAFITVLFRHRRDEEDEYDD